MCAATAAARHGAHGDNNCETGLLEEMMLGNHYRNPDKNDSIWDSILQRAHMRDR